MVCHVMSYDGLVDRWSKEKFVSRFLENKHKVLSEAGLQVVPNERVQPLNL
jgi:hypothetical protein